MTFDFTAILEFLLVIMKIIRNFTPQGCFWVERLSELLG